MSSQTNILIGISVIIFVSYGCNGFNAKRDVLAPWDTIPSLEINDKSLKKDQRDSDLSNYIVEGRKSKNIIFIIIDDYEDNNNPSELWKEYFDVQGFSQNCGTTNENCDCDRLLRENIANLFTWAHKMDIITGFVLSNNTNVEEQLKIDSHEGQFLGIPYISSKNKSILHTNFNPDYETSWDFLEWFGKIKRNVLNSLKSKTVNLKNNQSLPTTTIDLIEQTLRGIKALSRNERNFILTVTLPAREFIPAFNFLKNQDSTKKQSIFIITGTCSRQGKSIPYLAHGSNPENFHDLHAVWEFPRLIESLTKSTLPCSELGCLRKKRDSDPITNSTETNEAAISNKFTPSIVNNTISTASPIVTNNSATLEKHITSLSTEMSPTETNTTASTISSTPTKSTPVNINDTITTISAVLEKNITSSPTEPTNKISTTITNTTIKSSLNTTLFQPPTPVSSTITINETTVSKTTEVHSTDKIGNHSTTKIFDSITPTIFIGNETRHEGNETDLDLWNGTPSTIDDYHISTMIFGLTTSILATIVFGS